MREFSCKCKSRDCGHSLIEAKDGGLRLVSRKEWFRAMGIPRLEDAGKVAVFLSAPGSKAKVKWQTEFEYKEAA